MEPAESRSSAELSAKTLDGVLSYLKSKARLMALAATGSGLGSNEESPLPSGMYTGAAAEVADAMDILLNRALAAEAEAELERQKAKIGDQEVKKKSAQVDGMWSRVEEMERVAAGTSSILKEMELKLQDMEQETFKQRQRADENEQELLRVKHDFGILRASVDGLIKARGTIRSLERRIQEVERISERLTARVKCLESGRRDSEVEVQRLLRENDKLRGELDIKDAEVAAVRDHVRMLVSRS